MGVKGASFATMFSQFVGCTLLLVGCGRGGNIAVSLRKFSPRFELYREIFRGGLPALLRQSFASVATICLNHVAGNFGDAAIAAISIVQRVTLIANSALLGFGQGFQPVCGFNYGARRYDRVKRAFWFCVKVAFSVMLAVGALGWFFAPEIITVFRDDPKVIEIGTLALRLQCLTYPLMGWVILNNMMLQTIGKAIQASVLAMARQGLFLLPPLFLLTPVLGVLSVQMSQPLADAGSFLLALWLGIGVLRGMKEEKT
jgi:Na+-driven multidrug efflux pump